MTTILISAGDLSGERHAAGLVRALRRRLPEARFVGMGGAAMAAAGVDLRVDQRKLAVGGLFELAGSLGRIVSAWHGMTTCLDAVRPDLVVLVDSGGFNLPFAARVRAHSKAKILYYVAPQVWAWRPGRLRRLAQRCDRIAVILPFEPDFYALHGVSVDYVGHPALDGQPPASPGEPAAKATRAREALGLPTDRRLLGLFPGSRRNELARHLPIQLEAFLRLRAQGPDWADLEALVGLAPNLDEAVVRDLARVALEAAPNAIHFVGSGSEAVIEAVDVALAKPGTITVELMHRLRPMVVMGRAHPLTALILSWGLRSAWLSMPNLIAQAEIVPERMQADATADRIAAALAPLFEGPAREEQIEALARARARLGPPGAAERVAAIAEEMLGTLGA